MKPPEPAEPTGKDAPKSEPAKRAVVKPKEKKPPTEESWKGGVDHFGEEV
jgi:hypothetical protein